MDNKVVNRKSINITVGTNKDGMPVDIQWQAEGAAEDNPPCKGMLLSLMDRQTLDTLRIDLWTQDLQIFEMDRFMFQTLKGLADTYVKATNNTALGNDMQAFIEHFGKATEIIPTEENQEG